MQFLFLANFDSDCQHESKNPLETPEMKGNRCSLRNSLCFLRNSILLILYVTVNPGDMFVPETANALRCDKEYPQQKSNSNAKVLEIAGDEEPLRE